MTPRDEMTSSSGGGGGGDGGGVLSAHDEEDDFLNNTDVNSIMDSIFGDGEMMDPTIGVLVGTTNSSCDAALEEEEIINLDEETKSLIDDMIDPNSVDFQPMFRKDDVTKVPYNYHTNEDTREHQKLLQRKYSTYNYYDNDDVDDNQSLTTLSTTSGINVSKAIGRTTTSEWYSITTITSCIQPIWWMIIEKSWQLRYLLMGCITTEDGKSIDFIKLLVGLMLCFIFYEGFFQAEKDSQELLSIQAASGVIPKKIAGSSSSLSSSHNTMMVHFIDHAPSDTILPEPIDNAFRNVDDLPMGIMDTPIYWHIPRSGGTTMKLIMSMCMGRVVACEQGAGHQLDEQLEILNKPFGNFANVDTSTPLGLERAAEMGLIPSRMVDVVLTPHIMESTQLFDTHHKGRLFAMFRHPVDRIVSLYYFLRMPDQAATVGLDIQDMSLAQFAADFSENWMVRALTGQMTGGIDDSHLQVAKELLRKKFLIGLLDQKTESLRRMEVYFGWRLPSRVAQTCKNNMFYFEPQSKNIHPELTNNNKELSPLQQKEYDILVEHNIYDIKLYEYAKRLFEEQEALIK